MPTKLKIVERETEEQFFRRVARAAQYDDVQAKRDGMKFWVARGASEHGVRSAYRNADRERQRIRYSYGRSQSLADYTRSHAQPEPELPTHWTTKELERVAITDLHDKHLRNAIGLLRSRGFTSVRPPKVPQPYSSRDDWAREVASYNPMLLAMEREIARRYEAGITIPRPEGAQTRTGKVVQVLREEIKVCREEIEWKSRYLKNANAALASYRREVLDLRASTKALDQKVTELQLRLHGINNGGYDEVLQHFLRMVPSELTAWQQKVQRQLLEGIQSDPAATSIA